jgi:D-alanyl-D-alanine carboxypeptidase/D-alanyl-D-alanine-endopeptidase (penicillin-binding protein 4)
MKLQLFNLFFCISSLFATAFSQNSIQSVLNTVVSTPEFTNAGVSFLAIDVATGDKIASHNPQLALPTASTAKLFSTAAALEILGPDYKPQTRIYTDGTIDENGSLNGNVWIRGGGDVTLGSKFFNEPGKERDFLTAWVDSLKKAGIKTIKGAVYADGSEFGYSGIPDGWSWNDMGNYYGAGPAGICVFDNMIKFRFKSGSYVGAKTELVYSSPNVPGLVLHNYVTSGKVLGDNAYIFGGPYSMDRFANGVLPLNKTAFEVKGSMPDPEFQLAYELCQTLNSAGISVENGPKSVRMLDLQKKDRFSSGFTLLFTHQGQTIKDIATVTNMKSINLFAEGLVCLIGYKLTGNGSTEEGIKQIEKYWAARFSTSGLFLKDGSGLSRSNGISAGHFCELLKAMALSKNSQVFFSTLPVAGRSGTLTSLCKDQPGQGRVVAKSGTMARIKSYSGYVNSKSGKKIAFAFVITNFNGSSSAATDKIEKVLNSLAVY